MVEKETKNCPHCNEEIKWHAIKCRYCRNMLTEEAVSTTFIVEEKTVAQEGFSANRETKPCPHCGERIKLNAMKCRYCKRILTDELVSARHPTDAETASITAAIKDEDTKECPHCGELVKKNAIKCRFCKKLITEELPSTIKAAQTIEAVSTAYSSGVEMKNCSYCKMPIKLNAIKCRYCRRMLVEEKARVSQLPEKVTGFGTAYSTEAVGDTKECLLCGEEIKKDAIKCRYCKGFLPGAALSPAYLAADFEEKTFNYMKLIAVLLVVLGSAGFVIGLLFTVETGIPIIISALAALLAGIGFFVADSRLQ